MVRAELEDIVRALDDVPELDALLENPETDSQVKADVLEQVLGEADELVRNFLRLLVEKGRSGEIEEIARELDRLVAAEERRLSVELTTAYELSDADARALLQQIEQASGRKVVATRQVDPALIGGFVLQAGSMRVDASVRGRIERLRDELVRRN